MNLKESHELGAIDSINQASRQSSDAQYQLDTAATRLDSEFKPILDKLKQKLEMSKEKLRKSDELLSKHFNTIVGNVSLTESSIFDLNRAVCGGRTSASEKCDAVCGGALCGEGKCGSNSSSCGSLMDSYLNLVNARKSFDELYGAQELIFKRILTKVRHF